MIKVFPNDSLALAEGKESIVSKHKYNKMQFFLHSTTARRRPKLEQLKAKYGLAGIGFYWQAVELIMVCNEKVPIDNFLAIRYKPIRFWDVYDIIENYDLFDVDEQHMVSLRNDPENGIGEPSIKNLLQFTTESDPLRASSRVSSGASSGVSSGASSGVSSGASLRPGHSDIDKEKIRVEIEAQKLFDSFMEARCPHLLLMEEPLALEDFRKLKKSYTWGQIQEVLLDMENDNNLYQNKRNGYRTALSWLKRRYKTNS